jgi:uncharacterized repeat protein (TIGR03803 family)
MLRIFGTLLAASLLSHEQTLAQTLTTLYAFTGGSDGSGPSAVSIGRDYVLYGTTSDGGQSGCGTIFSLTPPSPAAGTWSKAILYSWEGCYNTSYSSVVIGPDGELYGTSSNLGSGYGSVFSLIPPSRPGASWTKETVYEFKGGTTDGAYPSGVVVDQNGTLFGTTSAGGATGNGTVFALTCMVRGTGSPYCHGWSEQVLHNFVGSPSDGSDPISGLVIGEGGVLYGTTMAGGIDTAGPGCAKGACLGTIFSLTPPRYPAETWRETILYSAPEGGSADGLGFESGVVIGKGGVLYGVAPYGGLYCNVVVVAGCGVAYALSPPASPEGKWVDVQIHAFAGIGADDAINPSAGLAIGKNGALYGTSYNGGFSGVGVVYALNPPASLGESWTETILYNFDFGGATGSVPSTPVTVGSGGLIYGTTSVENGEPEPIGYGTIFSLTP